MASIVAHGERWRAYVYVRGRRATGMFRTRREAAAWAARLQQELAAQCTWRAPKLPILPLEKLQALPRVPSVAAVVSGVYFLWHGQRLVYIGQSKSVVHRLASHRSKPPAPFDSATFLQIPHPWQLAIEQLYIEAYLPLLMLPPGVLERTEADGPIS